MLSKTCSKARGMIPRWVGGSSIPKEAKIIQAISRTIKQLPVQSQQ